MFKKIRDEIRRMKIILRELGFKALIRQYGWKLAVIVFFYYLIRDSILYLLIPYLIAQHVL